MSNGNLGVFGWIRESVRRSVLLGFSDAVEQIGGGVADGEELHPHLTAVLRDSAPKAISLQSDTPATSGRTPKKRLGRSLEQLRNTKSADGTA